MRQLEQRVGLAETRAAEQAQRGALLQQKVEAAEAQVAQHARHVAQLERIRQKNLHRITDLKQVGTPQAWWA